MNVASKSPMAGWIFLAALLSTSAAWAAAHLPGPDRAATLAAAKLVTTEKYPDADTVLVDDVISVIYNADGTDDCIDEEYVIALTEKGRRELSTLTIGYSKAYGTAVIELAEIIRPDGTSVAIDIAANSREMVDPGQMGANIYDPNNKQITLSLPGIEVGDIRHLRVRRADVKTRMPNAWSDYQTLESDSPIVSMTYAVSSPKELPLARKALRAEIPGTVSYSQKSAEEGRTLHLWKVRNVPQMFPEPDMPAPHTVVQRLLVSTLPNWESVSRWYHDLCEAPISDTTPEMKAKVAELVKGAASDEEKIRAIFAFVSQQVRYMGVTTEDVAPGYEPHPVSVTFGRRYGVCRDKAALLAAMLRLAGFESDSVLIYVGPKRDPEVPTIFFNHAITAVRHSDGSYQLMDCTNESTKDLLPTYLCDCSYIVASAAGDTLRVVPIVPASQQLFKVRTKGALDETGNALYTSRLFFDGVNDNAYRSAMLRRRADKRRSFFEGILRQTVPGAEVLSLEITPENLQDTETPLAVKLEFRVPAQPVRGDLLDALTPPLLSTSLGYANFTIGSTGLTTRKYPLTTEIACGTDEQLEIDYSAAMGEPQDELPVKSVDRAGISYLYDVNATNGVLRLHRAYSVNVVEIPPEEYQALKHAREEIEQADRFLPLFTARADEVRPDVEYLRDHTSIELTGAGSWVETREWSKRVLTYNGRKTASELKYSYNPVWSQMELVSAVVSNMNGKVFTVGEKELNLMDAGWVSSAPRYPAAKTLVASLPGVEVGSVITVKTRHVAHGRPFFSLSKSFDDSAPRHDTSLTLTASPAVAEAWKRLTCRTYGGEKLEIATNAARCVWTRPCSPALRNEANAPAQFRYLPAVFASTGDWKSYAATVKAEFERHAAKAERAAARARELTAGETNLASRARRVRDEVMRTIRLAGPRFDELPPTELSDADETLKFGYGNRADRAILLAAMLRAIGVPAEFALASSDDLDDPERLRPRREIPQRGYYSIPLVKATVDGAVWWLNSGTQYDEPGAFAEEGAFALDSAGCEIQARAEETLRDRAVREFWVELNEFGNARVAATNWYYGAAVGPFRKRFSELVPEERSRALQELVGGLSHGAEPVGDFAFDLESYPGWRAYAATVAGWAKQQGRQLVFRLPDAADTVFAASEGRRISPYYDGTVGESDFRLHVTFPKGYSRWAMVPSSRTWNLPGGLGTVATTVTRAVRADGRLELVFERKETRRAGELPAELYPALLEYNRLAAHDSSEVVIVE